MFVEMVVTAMKQASETVSLELLTYKDLAQKNPETKSLANTSNDSKLYLILTYIVAFDRVHYPLPLQMVELGPSTEPLVKIDTALQDELQDLKNQVSDLEKKNADLADESNRYFKETLRLEDSIGQLHQTLQKANSEHATEIKDLITENKMMQRSHIGALRKRDISHDKSLVLENLRLKNEIQSITADRQTVETAFTSLRDDNRRDLMSIQREFQKMTTEFTFSAEQSGTLDKQLSRCYALIETLLDELKIEKERASQEITRKDSEVKSLREKLQSIDGRSMRSSLQSLHPRAQSQESILPRMNKVPQSPVRLASIRMPPRTKSRDVQQRVPSNVTPLSSRRRSAYIRSESIEPVRGRQSRPRTPLISSSASPRFDPTAYVQEQRRKREERSRSASQRSRSASVDSIASQRTAINMPMLSKSSSTLSLKEKSSKIPMMTTPIRQRSMEQHDQSFSTQRPQHKKLPFKKTVKTVLKSDHTEDKENTKVGRVEQLESSLKKISTADVDARLDVLQSYFQSLREQK